LTPSGTASGPEAPALNSFQGLLLQADMRQAYVYILSNKHRTTFYIGSTVDLRRRFLEHRRGKEHAFTAKYNLQHLVYYETLSSIHDAKERERQLKNWHREWKLNLIKEKNPQLRDLSAEILGQSDAETSSGDSDAETSSASTRRKQKHAHGFTTKE
jgi:putative endonuclease